MKIDVLYDEPTINFPVLGVDENFFNLEFLIDTGYTGSIIISVNKNWDIFKVLDAPNLKLLPKSNWIALANNMKVKTYISNITLYIKGDSYTLPLTIIESMEEDTTTPLLGMKFLQFMKSHLSLDFKNNTFSLT